MGGSASNYKTIEIYINIETLLYSFPQYNINDVNEITNEQFKEIFGFYLGVKRESLDYDNIYNILSKIKIKIICDKTTSAPCILGYVGFNSLITSIYFDEILYFDYIMYETQPLPIITFTTNDNTGIGIKVIV